MSPQDVVRVAKKRGLSAISITDHNTFLGSYIAMKRGAEEGVILVPGAEFRTEFGDVLLLCSRIPLASVLKLKSGSRVTKYVEFLSVVELAATENCVTVAAHPYAVSREGCGRLFELRHLDCVEVHNSSSDIVTNFYTAYVANSKKCRIAGSDAHVPEMIGSAYTLVEIGKFDAESVVEGIRKSRVEPRYSAALDFLKSLSSIRSRTLHSLRARLSARRNHWERSCSYSI